MQAILQQQRTVKRLNPRVDNAQSKGSAGIAGEGWVPDFQNNNGPLGDRAR
jgi:hypothetical protein